MRYLLLLSLLLQVSELVISRASFQILWLKFSTPSALAPFTAFPCRRQNWNSEALSGDRLVSKSYDSGNFFSVKFLRIQGFLESLEICWDDVHLYARYVTLFWFFFPEKYIISWNKLTALIRSLQSLSLVNSKVICISRTAILLLRRILMNREWNLSKANNPRKIAYFSK